MKRATEVAPCSYEVINVFIIKPSFKSWPVVIAAGQRRDWVPPFQSLLARGSSLTHCKSMGKDYLKAKMLWYNGPPRLSHTRDQTSTATAGRIQQTPANIKATHRFEVVHELALLC